MINVTELISTAIIYMDIEGRGLRGLALSHFRRLVN